MKFRRFLNEDAPMGAPAMGGPAGAPPIGGDPMGGGGTPPPMGGPAGAPPMGGDPMGGGGMPPPMGGGMPSNEPPLIPQHADVWDVLDAIFNHKKLAHDEEYEKQQQQKDAGAGMSTPPGMGGPALMA